MVEAVVRLEAHLVKPVAPARFRWATSSASSEISTPSTSLGAVLRRVQRKRAVVAEAIQHPRARAQRRDGRAVLLLIQEEARLLAVPSRPRRNRMPFSTISTRSGTCAAQQPGGLFHALQPAHRHVAALPDALRAGRSPSGDRQIMSLMLLDAQRQRLQHQHVAELIHHQAGQESRDSE